MFSRIKLLLFIYKSSRSFPFHGKNSVEKRGFGELKALLPIITLPRGSPIDFSGPWISLIASFVGFGILKQNLGRDSGLKVCS